MGLNHGVPENLLWLNADELIYPCGRHLVFHHVGTGAQRYLTCGFPHGTVAKSPFALHPTRKYMALSGVVRCLDVFEVQTKRSTFGL